MVGFADERLGAHRYVAPRVGWMQLSRLGPPIVVARLLGRNLPPLRSMRNAAAVREATEKELAARGEFGIFEPANHYVLTKPAAGFRRMPSWKVADVRATVKARLVAKGLQDPDVENGLVAAAGCGSSRSIY